VKKTVDEKRSFFACFTLLLSEVFIMMSKMNITELSIEELGEFVQSVGEKKFRVEQISKWVYDKSISSWQHCHNISKKLIEKLEENFNFHSLTLTKAYTSKRNDSIKLLFHANDGASLEAVIIINAARTTVCLSTQIGCKFNCSFCASGKNGFIRDLTAAEIIDQFRLAQLYVKRKIDNIVFMGMGEPLDNYDSTVKALRTFISSTYFGLSSRRITVSTVGFIPGIKKFAREELSQVKLSVSLHAAIDSKRKQIMPIEKQYPLREVLKVLQSVRSQFRRTVTLEYILIKNFNDSKSDVTALIKIAKELKAKINVIGYNKVHGVSFVPPSNEDLDAFAKQIERNNVPITIRYSAGNDITAACGQLRLVKD